MQSPLLQVKGVGPATAEHLAAAGITTIESLAAATVEQLAGFPGFGDLRARQVIAHAEALLADAADATTDDAAALKAVPQPATERQPPDPEDPDDPKKARKDKGDKKVKKEKKEKNKKSKKKGSKKEKAGSAKVKKEGGKKKKAKKKKK